jgi:asparagine N-glycosylation enzyme membrane subunit Stt3
MQDINGLPVEVDAVEQKSSYSSMEESIAKTNSIYLMIGAVVIGLVFLFLQFSTNAILDIDGYYHIKWSRLLWEGMLQGKIPHDFPWLPFTTLNPQDYVDHHLLFHILLIPFTWFGDLRIAAKVAAVLFGSLAVLSCYWLIVRYQISYTFVWLIALLASSAPFLFRMSMTRAQAVSIVFMVTGIYLLFERKYRLLAPLAFLYVWTYSLFVMLCAASVIWFCVIYWSERRFDWQAIFWTAVGTLAGFIVNPYFPKNIMLFIAHAKMKITASNFSTDVGAEWYSYDSWYLLSSSAVAFAAMLIGYISFNWTDKRRSARPLFFLIFSTLLLIITFRSRRFVEYWPPFAVLFAAFSLQNILDGIPVLSKLPASILEDIRPFLDTHEHPIEIERKSISRKFKLYIASGIAIFLCAPLVINVYQTFETIRAEESPVVYQDGMRWVKANVPKNEIIFNTDWDDFPKLFFYSSDHRYVSGLDPTYLLNQNRDLSNLYRDITLGRIEDPAPFIRDRFKSRYIFTDNKDIHNDFYAHAIDSGWVEELYTDRYCTVLHIMDNKRDSKQEADPSNSSPSIEDMSTEEKQELETVGPDEIKDEQGTEEADGSQIGGEEAEKPDESKQ